MQPVKYCNVALDPSLTVGRIQGLAVLMTNKKRGKTFLKPYHVQSEEKMDDWANDAMGLIFDVWRSTNHFSRCYYLYDTYLEYEKVKLTINLFPTLLEENVSGPRTITCEYCGKIFNFWRWADKVKFRDHQRRVHKFQDFKCDCKVEFKSKNDVLRHVKLVHREDYESCNMCSYVAQAKAMKRHKEEYHASIVCNICGKVCPNPHALKVHVHDHKTFTCEFCGETLQGYTKLRKHRKEVHDGKAKCRLCKIIFDTRELLNTHLESEHYLEGDRYMRDPYEPEEEGGGMMGGGVG